MLVPSRALFAFGLFALALGAPEPTEPAVRPATNKCSPTGPFLRSASGHVKATPFCSSYLGITPPTHTRTITKTQKSFTTITITRGTTTVTDPNTFTAPATTTTETTTETAATSTIVITTCESTVKRGLAARTGAPEAEPNQNFAAAKSYPPAPTWLPNWPTARIVTACSCLCVETPKPVQTSTTITVSPTIRRTTTVKTTITETPTVTPTSTETKTITSTPSTTTDYCPPTVPPTCSNQGMQWSYYENPWGNNGDSTYSQYDPEYMKTNEPVVNGVAITAGGFSGVCQNSAQTLDFYGNQEQCELFSLNYRGYLYAPQSGDFVITLTSADDICLIWVGNKAYSGYTRANADLDHTYSGLGAGVSYDITLDAGQYIPLRFVMAQGYGPFGFSIKITAPDGTVILSDNSAGSDYLQQYPCDPVFGLPYPPWGQET